MYQRDQFAQSQQVAKIKEEDCMHALDKKQINSLSKVPSYRELYLNEQQKLSKKNLQIQYQDYINKFSKQKKMVSYKNIISNVPHQNYYPDIFTFLSMQIPYFCKIDPALLKDYNQYYSLIQTFNTQKLFVQRIDSQQQLFFLNRISQNSMKSDLSSPKNLQEDIQQQMIRHLDLSQIITNQNIESEAGIKINKKFILYLQGRYRALKFFSQIDTVEGLQFEVCKIVYQLIQTQQANQLTNLEYGQQKKNSYADSAAGSSFTASEKTEEFYESQLLNGKRKRPSEIIEKEEEDHLDQEEQEEEKNIFLFKNQNYNSLQKTKIHNNQPYKQLQKYSSVQKQELINEQGYKDVIQTTSMNESNSFIQLNLTCVKQQMNKDSLSNQNNLFNNQIQNPFQSNLKSQDLNNKAKEELSKIILSHAQQQQLSLQSKDSTKEKEKRKQIFHNLSKYLMHLLIEMLSDDHLDQFEIIPGYNLLIKNIIQKLKQSGKRNKLSQTYYFNHQHYNCIFLTLNTENIKKLINQKDFVDIHSQVFGKINFDNEQEVLHVNIIKMIIGRVVNIQLDYLIQQIQNTLGTQIFEICNIITDCQAKVSYLINVSEGIKKLQKGSQLIRF